MPDRSRAPLQWLQRAKDLCLANCYFAGDSLEFPALLPLWDAPSGRSFHSVRINF